jgi:hypothetical protein
VDEEAGVGMRHSYAPPGLWIQVSTLIPQARAWGYRLVPATRAECFGARFAAANAEPSPDRPEPANTPNRRPASPVRHGGWIGRA